MGREVRIVPPNWDHPKMEIEWPQTKAQLQPMFDRDYDEAKAEWIAEMNQWEAGTHENLVGETPMTTKKENPDYWEWAGPPPERAYYRTWKMEDASWVQVWETVSEGTPVSPPFETEDELIEYLVANGDFWDQKRGDKAWGRESATDFVKGSGWSPSMMIGPEGIKTAKEMDFYKDK